MNIETDGKALFEQKLPEIEKAVRAVAGRHRLSVEDGQELYSLTMLKLIQRDYAVLRAFGNQSSWGTYLTSVARRVWLDHRNRELGKWRPCARVRRLGALAIQLDRSINRDGMTPQDAIAQLRLTHRAESITKLKSLARKVPRRCNRRMIPLKPDMPIAARTPAYAPWEQKQAMARLRAALRSAFRDLSDQERKLLWLRFAKSWTIKRIADHTGLAPRSLYRQFQNILRRLRRSLETTGLSWEEIRRARDLSTLCLQADLQGISQEHDRAP